MIEALPFALAMAVQPPADLPPPPPDDDAAVDVEVDLPEDVEPVDGEDPPPPPPTFETLPPPSVAADGPARPPPSKEAIARDSELQLDRPREKRRDRWKRPGSPQRFAFEFKIGPYLPDVDTNYRGPGLGPYAQIFGRTDATGAATRAPKVGVLPVLGFEWQFVYLAGPLALGTEIGFFRDTAKALLTNPDPGENLRSQADKVAFNMIPVSLLAIYRFELPADRFRVPLVPYVKAGPNYTFWWTTDGSGDIAVDDAGRKGVGGVWGWQVNLGAMLRLDFIEPGTAKKLDQATGINHTYLFGEFMVSRIDNFGVGNSIQLGDITGLVGLAIEF